jgi:hypothetical protein
MAGGDAVIEVIHLPVTEEQWIDGILWAGYLAGNLAVAAALCQAWADGWDSREEYVRSSGAWTFWHPGCGHEVPR